MEESNLPVFKKTYTLFQVLYSYRHAVSRQDRYTVWRRAEDELLSLLRSLILAGQSYKSEKLPRLEQASLHVDVFKVFVRLMHDSKIIDTKKYLVIQGETDEIGRMIGGWIKSLRPSRNG